jgi:uncharacterized protein YkwD
MSLCAQGLAKGLVVALALAAPVLSAAQMQPFSPSPYDGPANLQTEAGQLFALANQARAGAGEGRLEWDPALAAAALEHCRRMVREGPISHRYGGEPELTARAAQAGAHFSLIEENVAIGPSAAAIHDEWMHSPGHRSNLLNPDADRIGVAVIATRGVLYAVADYTRAVLALAAPEVEAHVAALIRTSGVAIVSDPAPARAACATDEGFPRSATGPQPRFIMRWQDSDLTRLPQALADRLASGQYRQAAVGSCPARNLEGSFTAYRVAVLLY